jgi:hypothetical protein
MWINRDSEVAARSLVRDGLIKVVIGKDGLTSYRITEQGRLQAAGAGL